MDVGVFLPPWGPMAAVDNVERFTASVEAHGYNSLWVGDHVVIPRAVASSYHYRDTGTTPFEPDEPRLEPLTLLAYVAGRTQEILLGVSVYVLPMRNPVLSAGLLANLQALSRGRMHLGIGVGWMREEFEALGADFDARGAITDEYVAILRHLWQGNSAPFRGKHYEFDPVGLQPRPDPPIPVTVGGNSEMAMRRAARLGAGWHPLRLSPQEARAAIERFRVVAQEDGRDPDTLSVCLRAALLDLDTACKAPDEAGADVVDRCRDLLEGYRDAGVDEFVVEFPFPGTPAERQIEWLSWLKDERVL